MIFPQAEAELIRERRKTQTRQPTLTRHRPCKIGHLYQVQLGPFKPGLFGITILNIHTERLDDISNADIRHEGHKFRSQFVNAWTDHHGTWNPDTTVWVITFGVGDQRDRLDIPRFLAARTSRGDYTDVRHLAMPDEPEPVSRLEQEAITARARTTDRSRLIQPLRGRRDRLADEIDGIRTEIRLSDGSDRLDRTLRMFERALADLDRQIAA